jgi:photosystem II stability/assembly factor-like uncharacterized protein
MKNMKKIKLIVIICFAFILSSCSLGDSGVAANDGGVFVSTNSGESWRQMALIPTISGTPGSIANIDVNGLTIDPSDSSAVYMASVENGLYYTYNVTRGWNKVSSLPSGVTINSVAVDNNNKCRYFVAAENKLFRTIDCGRTFAQTYFDNNTGVNVTAVAVDHYNSNNIYLGTSRGDILRSLDGGNTWRAIQRLKDGAKEILVSPKDSRTVFVATTRNGMYKFNASGGASLEELEEYRNKFDNTNWTDYGSELKEFSLGVNFKSLAYSYADDSILLATDKVIIRSYDDGRSWTKLSLLTPEEDSTINAVAVNPKNADELFYVTNTSFFRSLDGGDSWSVKQLPTTRIANSVLVDFNNPNVIYIGIAKPPKK